MKTLRVKTPYVGLDTAGRMIYPGDYQEGDSALYHLESALVDIGYAEWVEEETPPPKPTRRKVTVNVDSEKDV